MGHDTWFCQKGATSSNVEWHSLECSSFSHGSGMIMIKRVFWVQQQALRLHFWLLNWMLKIEQLVELLLYWIFTDFRLLFKTKQNNKLNWQILPCNKPEYFKPFIKSVPWVFSPFTILSYNLLFEKGLRNWKILVLSYYFWKGEFC